MEIKLDYHRMADMVYAMSALRAFETGAERIIGRHEEPALMRMFERTLLEVSLKLRPAVRAINTSAGSIDLDLSEPIAHQMLEAAVTRTVLADLRLSDEDPQPYVNALRALSGQLPKIAPH